MIKNLLSVGALTLLSRATGFLRDILLGAVLGAGLLADAFVVAFRLPNHFRAIFAEGAFNAAYIPTYSGTLERGGERAARDFANQIYTGMLLTQIAFLAIALAAMPFFVDLLAPGFRENPEKFAAAVTMTRITFPYLLCIALVTLHSGTLNAHDRFAAAAFAPVLLNVAMIACLALAFLFPNAGIAAAVGITISGFLQLALLMGASAGAGLLERPTRPRWTPAVGDFVKRLGPAVIGSAGVQIALFADTIIASLLPTGGPSSIYYADRLYQLPFGVIGIAAGTVLLPQMSRHFAAGHRETAFATQNRTMALSLALTAPFAVAFMMIPQTIMRGVFERGAFTEAAADAAAAVLAAYGTGLIAAVLLRSAVAGFQAAGDTTTPMVVTLIAAAVNIGLKVALFRPYGAVGLAAATAAGIWINLALLVLIGVRRQRMRPDHVLAKVTTVTVAAAFCLSLFALYADMPVFALTAGHPTLGPVFALLLLGIGGGALYALVLVLGFAIVGFDVRTSLRQALFPRKAALTVEDA